LGPLSHARPRLPVPTRGWLLQATPFFVPASLILVLAFGLWAALLQTQLADAHAKLGLLSQPDVRVITLPVVSAPPGAEAHMFLSPQSSTALLTVNMLKPLPASQTYEFWLIRGANALPAGIFNVDATGNALLPVNAPEPLGAFEKVGLTN